MKNVLHITSGDSAGGSLSKSGVPGKVFIWHDILYDGPRNPGWPSEETLAARARFIEQASDGGLHQESVLHTLKDQYNLISAAADYERIVLWFDACLFDQAMLVHVLTCLSHVGARNADLLCIDEFPGIVPFDGLGQLLPGQLASAYDQRRPVTDAQLEFAETVDKAFALQNKSMFAELAGRADAPLSAVPSAVARWLLEFPDEEDGLGQLERLAFNAIRSGCDTPDEIFSSVSAHDPHPHFWGDTTLWAKINALTDREPPLVRLSGPAKRLPQWEGTASLKLFRVYSA